MPDKRRPQAPRHGLSGQRAPADPGAGLTDLDGLLAADDDAGDNQFVGAVARALAILNAFRPAEGPLGNAELAQLTGLSKPTVSRLTYTLVRCGYLNFNARQRVYALGPGALALGHVAMASMDVRALARPLMQELASHANFNVGLGTRDQHLMVYTDAYEGQSLVGLRLFAGSRIPVMTSAMGRAYLAGMDRPERELILAELKERHGDEWPLLVKAVNKAVAEVNANGFCVSLGEWQKDIHGVAAPIRTPDGGAVYAVNLGGPAYLLPENELRGNLGRAIADVARKVTQAMTPEAPPIPAMPRRITAPRPK